MTTFPLQYSGEKRGYAPIQRKCHLENLKNNQRATAITVLTEILENGAYTNIALRKALAKAPHNKQANAFVTELVNTTIRNLILIDHIIDSFSNADELKPIIRNILRISVCQLRFIERVPSYTAVDEAVKLARAYGFERLAGFVNGILRGIDREPNKPAFSQKDLVIRYSYPSWLVNSLVKWLGAKGAAEFCENSHRPAQITVLPNTCKTDAARLIAALEAEDVTVTPIEGSPMLALRNTGNIAALSAFKDGLFIVADPGIMAAIDALGLQQGQTLIDLCAAPGGKSFAAAVSVNNKARILAFDIYPHKLELLNQQQKRLGLSIIETKINDALVFGPALAGLADAVLVDAPCSGLGTLRHHAEIKYTRQPEDILDLAKKQAVMLARAARYVKKGGALVYCTCTVAREENFDVIDKFMQSHPNFSLATANQILPSEYSDGFFTAKMCRNA